MAKEKKDLEKNCNHPEDCKAPECDCKAGDAPKGKAKKKSSPPKKVGSLKERRLERQAKRLKEGTVREAPFASVEG